jgi:hypothetical protein
VVAECEALVVAVEEIDVVAELDCEVVCVEVNDDFAQPSKIPASNSYNASFKSLAETLHSANLSARK